MTTSQVMHDKEPITRVYHDEEDHGWQFHSEQVSLMKDAMIVALEEIVRVDASVLEIADLPPGWMAQRESPGAPWRRSLQYADAPQIIVDWSKVGSEEDFYDMVLPQCGSPSWHGRNLDALSDSWVEGEINEHGPPYAFGFLSVQATPSELISFRDSILEIAQKSIDENGGRYIQKVGQADEA